VQVCALYALLVWAVARKEPLAEDA
jgi:hypothetical protein